MDANQQKIISENNSFTQRPYYLSSADVSMHVYCTHWIIQSVQSFALKETQTKNLYHQIIIAVVPLCWTTAQTLRVGNAHTTLHFKTSDSDLIDIHFFFLTNRGVG